MSSRTGAATAAPPRRQMLAAAIDCFARHGYQGTSIARIAREAGVTKGALYYHFRDKEDLLFAAVTERVGEFERKVLRDVEPASDALSTLRRVVDACFFHATVSNHRRFIITLMVEALDTNPRISAASCVACGFTWQRWSDAGSAKDRSAPTSTPKPSPRRSRAGSWVPRSSITRTPSASTCARSSTRSSNSSPTGSRPLAARSRRPEEATRHGELQPQRGAG